MVSLDANPALYDFKYHEDIVGVLVNIHCHSGLLTSSRQSALTSVGTSCQ